MDEFISIICTGSFLLLWLYLFFIQSNKVSPELLETWRSAGKALDLTFTKPRFGLQKLNGTYKGFEVVIVASRSRRRGTSYTVIHQNKKMALFTLSPKPRMSVFDPRIHYIQEFDKRFKFSYGNEEFAEALFSNQDIRGSFSNFKETHVFFDREKISIFEFGMETEKENIVSRLEIAIKLTKAAVEVVENADFKIRRY